MKTAGDLPGVSSAYSLPKRKNGSATDGHAAAAVSRRKFDTADSSMPSEETKVDGIEVRVPSR